MDNRVFMAACREYDAAAIERILADALTYTQTRLPEGGRVLVKPNVLGMYDPAQNITTHPAVVEAVVRLLLDGRNEVIVADSGALPGRTGRALERTGLAALGARYGEITVRPFEEWPSRIHENPDNRFLKRVNLPEILDDVDGIVNLPKLKSHMLTRITAGVKNLFGCIPGGGKQQAHVIAPSAEEFAELIVDLYGFLQPRVLLNVLDGIVGLDGFGPGTGGRNAPCNFVAVSPDAVALDTALCGVIQQRPDSILTTRGAVARGLGSSETVTNQTLEPVKFRLPKKFPLQTFLFRHVSGVQRRKPAVIEQKCKRCGVCAEVCPVDCITMDGLPRWDYGRCIYCYCCHESCPHAAIKLRFSLSRWRP